jgi:hypothetical protein
VQRGGRSPQSQLPSWGSENRGPVGSTCGSGAACIGAGFGFAGHGTQWAGPWAGPALSPAAPAHGIRPHQPLRGYYALPWCSHSTNWTFLWLVSASPQLSASSEQASAQNPAGGGPVRPACPLAEVGRLVMANGAL